MDIHPWTKYDIAQARHEERLLRARAAMRARELRAEGMGDAGGTPRASSWLDRLRRKDVAEPASPRPA